MNPCPCGHLGSERCTCAPGTVQKYLNKISGPLLDRIDLLLMVRPVDEATLTGASDPASSAERARRVAQAHARQIERQGCSNAALDLPAIDRHCPLDPTASELLMRTARRLHWSSRGLHRVLRVARTAADLDTAAAIDARHVAEAISFRRALLLSPGDPGEPDSLRQA